MGSDSGVTLFCSHLKSKICDKSDFLSSACFISLGFQILCTKTTTSWLAEHASNEKSFLNKDPKFHLN